MAPADSELDDFCLQCIQLTIFVCSVFSWNNKNVKALIAYELSGFTCTHSLTMSSKFSIPHEAASCGIENFSFIVSELVQVNPDNSWAMSVLTHKYTSSKHDMYCTVIITDRWLFLYSLGILPRNMNLSPPWEHLLHTDYLLNLVWMCHHLMETTSITQALLKVTEDLVPLWVRFFNLITARRAEWKTGLTTLEAWSAHIRAESVVFFLLLT